MEIKKTRTIKIVTYEYPPDIGGIGEYIINQENLLSNSGFDTQIIKLENNIRSFGLFSFIKGKIKNEDLIFIHHAFPVLPIVFLLKFFYKIKIAVFFHGNDYDQHKKSIKRKILLKLLLRKVDFIFTNSISLQNDISREQKLDIKLWQPTLPRDIRKFEYKKPNFEKISDLLVVARLVERKGLQKIIQALTKVPDLILSIAGDGEYKEELEKLTKQLNLENRVNFLGKVKREEIPEIYQKHQIFIMPTIKNEYDREGFGIVYLEAAWFGLPIIASNLKEVKEAISSENGIFVNNQNDLINTLNNINKYNLDEMSKAGRKFVENHHLNKARKKLLNNFYE